MVPRFSLVRPANVPDALAAFAAADGDAAYYAGGTELLQVMKMGFAQFGTLIDLKGLPELRGITERAGGGVRIGGAVTHREIERSPVVGARLAGLARLERHVANVRVRNTGTLGGNLAFAEPHSDPATFLLVCDATVELCGAAGTRALGIGAFIVAPLLTAREADEIIVAVRFPRPERAAYIKFANPASRYAIVGVLASRGPQGVRVAVTGAGENGVFRVSAIEHALAQDFSEKVIESVAIPPDGLFDDLHGTAAYRANLVKVMAKRAVARIA